MNDAKYVGLDVHQATISAAVRDSDGKLVLEAILETKAETMLQFIHGLRGSLHVTFEEGTSADWLYTLLKPHVTEVLVCDPRKNALLKVGNKGDRIDARSDRIWEHWHARAKIQRCGYIYSATSVLLWIWSEVEVWLHGDLAARTVISG